MGDTIRSTDRLSFGPSERYLATKHLELGDTLEFNIVDYELEEVDTDFGSKLQFHLNVLKSSSNDIKPGKCKWNTICNAARELHTYLITEKVPAEGKFGYACWVMQLTVVDNGFKLEVIG